MSETTKDDLLIRKRMKEIGRKVLVLSGKGGVGKSTIAVNLAVVLAAAGKQVGLLDVDVHGPSIPKLLGVEGTPLSGTHQAINPLAVGDNLKVMSIGFLLRSADDAVIWRGPMKYNVIKQFLSDVEWGPLDFLIIDSPPGTGDEPLAVAQLIGDADGALIVTTPQNMALVDVRKCITFCRQISLPVIGVVENMSGFVCPHCGEFTGIFKHGGGEKMAEEMGVPFLGSIPLDPAVVQTSDEGTPYVTDLPHTEAGKIFTSLGERVLKVEKYRPAADSSCGGRGKDKGRKRDADGKGGMGEADREISGSAKGKDAARPGKSGAAGGGGRKKIALPVVNGELATHFGHCRTFSLVEIDLDKRAIVGARDVEPPPHEPGVLPQWLGELGVDLVIAGGMGQSAQGLFREKGIEVIVGAPADDPRSIVEAYLNGTLDCGENVCDH
ncbi:MAG: P-loop NTPase [Candidatus Krumholzibacteriota bacterium]|nr:P-loop NTPase [Candidatus Krumholzibacteriota bacterium]